MPTREITPEEELAKLREQERQAHFGIEVAAATSGAAIGAVAGAIAGPPGIVVGAVVGAAVGGLAGAGLDHASHEETRRSAELDAIGLDDDLDPDTFVDVDVEPEHRPLATPPPTR